MTFKQAIREHQIRCLCKAQDNLAKVRSGGFDLPDDVVLEVQAIMDNIPKIIRRLEGHPELAGTVPIGHFREMHEVSVGGGHA